MLADILEPIMGKGLIPADLETWKVYSNYSIFDYPICECVVLDYSKVD